MMPKSRTKPQHSDFRVNSEPKRLSALFRALASDLGFEKAHTEYREVLSFSALLGNGSYASFLERIGTWDKQQYVPDLDYFQTTYQLANFLKRYPFDDKLIDREAAAKRKFLAGEHKCRRMNQLFRAAKKHSGKRGRRRFEFLESVKSIFQEMIGPYRADFLGEFGRFGPGSSVGVGGQDTSFMRKIAERPLTVSPSALPYVVSAIAGNWHLAEALLGPHTAYTPSMVSYSMADSCLFVDYDNILYAKKNALTDRTIGVPPTLNSLVQLALGKYLEGRLKLQGVCLKTGQMRNQALARAGSVDVHNPMVTLDLANASGSISRSLVAFLLDGDNPSARCYGWWSILDSTRSRGYRFPGDTKTTPYELFVSMGNGFCFPLESLIFLAAVRAAEKITGDRGGTVYGDDIIVRQSSALLVIEHLWACGFRINTDKSFITGAFRESCGADFYGGVPVRPMFLSEQTGALSAFQTANVARRRGYTQLRKVTIGMLKPHLVLFRPAHLKVEGDSAIDEHLDVCMSSKTVRWNRDTQSWSWRELITLPVKVNYNYLPPLHMIGALTGAESDKYGKPRPFYRRATRVITRWSV